MFENMMEPEIRSATLADERALAVLMRAYYAEDGYVFHEERALGAVQRLLAEPSLGRLWVVASQQEIVGYVVVTLGFSLEYLGRDAFLDELYVAPEWRGRGLGQRALRLAEDECRKLGVNALHLEVERNKVDAQQLYEKVGFEHHDRHLMTKWLVPPDDDA